MSKTFGLEKWAGQQKSVVGPRPPTVGNDQRESTRNVFRLQRLKLSERVRDILKRLFIEQCLIYTWLNFHNNGFDSKFYFLVEKQQHSFQQFRLKLLRQCKHNISDRGRLGGVMWKIQLRTVLFQEKILRKARRGETVADSGLDSSVSRNPIQKPWEDIC